MRKIGEKRSKSIAEAKLSAISSIITNADLHTYCDKDLTDAQKVAYYEAMIAGIRSVVHSK